MRSSAMIVKLLVGAALSFVLIGCSTTNLAPTHEEAASGRSPVVPIPPAPLLMAPDFTLKDQNGQDVTLSKLRGQWVVLYFYPKDDTPGCTCEATEFTKVLESMKPMNAIILGISSDSVNTHRIFVEKYKLHVDLLSDPDHAVATNYGAWVHTQLGDMKYDRVIRSTMIIDAQGQIRYHWPEVIPQGHAERVSKKLAQLQAMPAQPVGAPQPIPAKAPK